MHQKRYNGTRCELYYLPRTLRPHQRQENERGYPDLRESNSRSVTKLIIEKEGTTYCPDTHDEERWVFVDARYGIERLPFGINSPRDRPWVGKKHPDGVEGDSEEMSEQCEEGWRYARGMS